MQVNKENIVNITKEGNPKRRGFASEKSFKAGWLRLCFDDQQLVINRVMERLGLSSKAGVYGRISGRIYLRLIEEPVIEEAFAGLGVDPWTGNRV